MGISSESWISYVDDCFVGALQAVQIPKADGACDSEGWGTLASHSGIKFWFPRELAIDASWLLGTQKRLENKKIRRRPNSICKWRVARNSGGWVFLRSSLLDGKVWGLGHRNHGCQVVNYCCSNSEFFGTILGVDNVSFEGMMVRIRERNLHQ